MSTDSRIADVKVGAFVVAALTILIVGSLWIAGSTFFRVRLVGYTVLMTSSAGVEAGDRVRFAGVKVGRITSVTLVPESEWPVVMKISLDPEIPIREDSRATISSAGFMGASFVVIEAGSSDAPLLPAGGTIYGSEQQGMAEAMAQVNVIAEKAIDLIDQVSQILDQVSTDISPILAGAQKLLSEDNVAEMDHILKALHETLDDSGPRIVALLTRLDSLAAKLETSADDLPELTAELRGLAGDLRTAVGPDGERLSSLLDTAQGTLEKAGSSLSILDDNRDELAGALRDMRDVAANFKELSIELKERPSSLIWATGDKDRKPGDGTEDRR